MSISIDLAGGVAVTLDIGDRACVETDRVNAIAPGAANTPGGSGFIEQAGGADKLARAYPLTGQVLSVSGGFTMV